METVRSQVKRLWKTCFHDPDDFIDLYFSLRYREEINSCLTDGSRVVSALQRIPYPMTCFGTVIQTAYISGACTDPAYRGKGMMRRLLAEAHRRMFCDGVLLATLIPAEPWLKAYYARSGYVPCFRQQSKLLTSSLSPVNNFNPELKISRLDLFKTLPKEVVSFLCSQLSEHPCCIQHTEEDWQVIVADHRLGGGDIWMLEELDAIRAVAFCLREPDGKLTVKELLADSDEMEVQLLTALFARCQVTSLLRLMPARTDEGYELGMARIIQVERMLQLVAAQDVERAWAIEVTDEAIPENTGCFRIADGVCRRGREAGVDYEPLSVGQLTAKLFANAHPYMNLMLN